MVKDMATAGIPLHHIGLMIRWPNTGRPVSSKTLVKHFEAELYTGTIHANTQVAGSLFKQAMAGNVAAQCFWAKTRMGWRETSRMEVTGKDGAPLQQQSGVLLVPTTLSIDDWEKTVSAQQAQLVKDGAAFLSGELGPQT